MYVQPFPSMRGRTQVSAGGGSEPVWSRTASELYYRGGGKIMAVSFTARNEFVASPPRIVLSGTFDNTQGDNHTGFDVLPDGRFLMVGRPAAASAPVTHLSIVYRPAEAR